LEVTSRVVTKPIYTVEHISFRTEAKFPMTIGVGVVLLVVSNWWLSDEMRKTYFSSHLVDEFSRSKIFVVGENVRPNIFCPYV